MLHNFKDGYCGMSKIEDDKSCLCYLTTAKNLRDSGNSIKKMEESILGKNRNLRKIFSDAKFLYDQPLSISQVSFSPKATVQNHLLMLGDAAGLITPLCGNGMSIALHSAKLAFEAISGYLSGRCSFDEMESAYDVKWKKEFAGRLRVGRIIQSIFGGESSTSLFLRTMHGIPILAKKVIAQTHGKPF